MRRRCGGGGHGGQLLWVVVVACSWVAATPAQQAPRTDPVEGTGSLKRSENTCMVVAYIHPYCAYASLSRYFKEGERDENMHGSCFTRSIEEPVVMCGDRKVIALACEEQVNDQ
uniref:Bifunctional inhibitor/plant lipid transfer protein/seed storage helical domain-containing protein n=1 Tax=Oryza punctata TaxID=4537 RepID=A0A0E0LS93_ORYPU